MNRITRIFSTILALSRLGLSLPAQDEGPFLDGRWGGAVDFVGAVDDGADVPGTGGGEGPEVLVLRLFPADPETGAPAGGPRGPALPRDPRLSPRLFGAVILGPLLFAARRGGGRSLARRAAKRCSLRRPNRA